MPDSFAPKSLEGDFGSIAIMNLNINFNNESLFSIMSTSMHYGAPKEIFQIAERLRRDMTKTEKLFGKELVKISWK